MPPNRGRSHLVAGSLTLWHCPQQIVTPLTKYGLLAACLQYVEEKIYDTAYKLKAVESAKGQQRKRLQGSSELMQKEFVCGVIRRSNY